MPITIGSNIASINAQRRLADATNQLGSTYERLSSGMRINRASDDSAGLAIANSLNADTRVFSQGLRNINDGISLLNISAGALTQLSNITQRQIELAEQAANGTYSTNQRTALNNEANTLVKEFNRIVQSTQFNGLYTLDGTMISGSRLQAGYGTDGGIFFTVGNDLARNVGSGTISTSASYSNAAFCSESQFADMNGDGILDMIVAAQSNGVRISFGNSDGSFQASVSYSTISQSAQSESVKIADVNGDGINDVISLDGVSTSHGTFVVLLGNSNGTLKAAVSYNPGVAFDSRGWDVGDVDGDGIKDVIISDFTANAIRVYKGNSNGSFGSSVTYTLTAGSQVGGLTLADMNNDGTLDIVAQHVGGGTQGVSTLIGNGNGSFKASKYYSNRGGSSTNTVSDFNGDGYLDVMSADYGTGVLTLSLGNGDGTLRAGTTAGTIATGWGNHIKSGDINGDGISDFVVTDDQHSTGYVFLGNSNGLGNGNGTFRLASTYSYTGQGGISNLIDLNNDGIVEIVTAQTGSGSMAIGFQSTTKSTSICTLDLSSISSARSALTTLRDTLNRITSEIGGIGAIQSRLGIAANNLTTARINYSAASSRITDADIGLESSELVRLQILQKSGAAILAQANLQPQLALQLLRY